MLARAGRRASARRVLAATHSLAQDAVSVHDFRFADKTSVLGEGSLFHLLDPDGHSVVVTFDRAVRAYVLSCRTSLLAIGTWITSRAEGKAPRR